MLKIVPHTDSNRAFATYFFIDWLLCRGSLNACLAKFRVTTIDQPTDRFGYLPRQWSICDLCGGGAIGHLLFINEKKVWDRRGHSTCCLY